MELEFAIQPGVEGHYSFTIHEGMVDWQPMIAEILRDVRKREARGVIAAKFHHALVEIIVEVARQAGEPRVVLTGGCFQNRYLTEHSVRRLTEAGFHPYWHQRIPPNDGGIALGQIIDAARNRRRFSAATVAARQEVAA